MPNKVAAEHIWDLTRESFYRTKFKKTTTNQQELTGTPEFNSNLILILILFLAD